MIDEESVAKLTLFRAFIIVVFPVLVVLAPVLESVIAINSFQMTVGTLTVTTVLGLIVGFGLLLLKSLSEKLLFRLLFLLCISGLVSVYLELLLFPYRDNLDFFGFYNGARPLEGIILFGAVCLGVLAVLIGVMWRYEGQFIDALAIMFAVSVLFTIVFAENTAWRKGSGVAESSKPVSDDKDLSIYIIFDGMIGSAGLRTDIPKNTELADEIDRFYRHYGFLHYPRAFSRHLETFSSIPAFLNGLSTGIPNLDEVVTIKNNVRRLNENLLFDDLHERNSVIHVYQTQYIDVCSHEAVVFCSTVSTADRFSSHIPRSVQVSSKYVVGIETLGRSFTESFITRRVSEVLMRQFHILFSKLAPGQEKLLLEFRSNSDLTFVSRFEKFAAGITSGKGGAYYGHFLTPHYPFGLNAQCDLVMERFSGRSEREFDFLVEDHELSPDQAKQTRKYLYGSYRDQVRCVYRKLSVLFDELKRQGRFDRAKITLMGDHGSRISNAYSPDLTSNQDLIDNYSALFAVKEPNSTAQSDPLMISVQQLLMAHQSGDKVGITGTIEQSILQNRMGNQPFISKMPSF